ncbi:MAG: hypothetical protein RBS78_05435 [Coriobacteriia bacterium]|jgi:hypothetical protein|nr:hypothetical protein [Coriobacteriia bacterium]
MAERPEEQEQEMTISKVSRRELRSMLRRWRLLDLDAWESLGCLFTLSTGIPEIRLYDSVINLGLREQIEDTAIEAAQLLASELETGEGFLISDGHWPRSEALNEESFLVEIVAASGITRAFGGAIKIGHLSAAQIQQLMEEVTKGALHARFDCGIVVRTSRCPIIWNPCHHADVHVFTDGSRKIVDKIRHPAHASGLLVNEEHCVDGE